MFRQVADIQPWDGGVVHGALWHITDRCERALDHYEGFPEFYGKQKVTIERADGVRCQALVYVMVADLPLDTPSVDYYRTMQAGYRDFGIPEEQLQTAVRHCR